MWKLKWDKGFSEFLSADKSAVKLVGLMVIGVALIFIGSLSTRTVDSTTIINTDEQRVAEMCSMIEGVGECRVMMTYTNDEVFAVLVVCDGAESVSVREKITSLFTSLYGIGSNRVEIQQLNNEIR